MAFVKSDRIQETSVTIGTGDILLAGAYDSSYRTFGGVTPGGIAMANGDTCQVLIINTNAASEWEIDEATYISATNALSRTTRLASSTGAAVSFTSGTKRVAMLPPASASVVEDNSGNAAIANDLTVGGNLSVAGSVVFGTPLPVVSGGTGVTGFGVVTSKTAGYAVLAADSYKDFDNNGAAGSVTFTLPASTVGLAYGFAVMEAQNLVVDAPGGVTIYLGALSTTAGGTITSNEVGSYLFIKCRSATEWIVQSSMGSWTPA